MPPAQLCSEDLSPMASTMHFSFTFSNVITIFPSYFAVLPILFLQSLLRKNKQTNKETSKTPKAPKQMPNETKLNTKMIALTQKTLLRTKPVAGMDHLTSQLISLSIHFLSCQTFTTKILHYISPSQNFYFSWVDPRSDCCLDYNYAVSWWYKLMSGKDWAKIYTQIFIHSSKDSECMLPKKR